MRHHHGPAWRGVQAARRRDGRAPGGFGSPLLGFLICLIACPPLGILWGVVWLHGEYGTCRPYRRSRPVRRAAGEPLIPFGICMIVGLFVAAAVIRVAIAYV